MHTIIAPYRRVTALNGHPSRATGLVGGHAAAILSQVPPAVWVILAAALVLLVGMVIAVAIGAPERGRREDAIRVLSLVLRVVRPSAFPGEERPPARTRPRRRKQVPGE